jgi:hypothetical protein
MLEAGDLVSPGRSSEEELPVVVVVVVVMGCRETGEVVLEEGETGDMGETGEMGVEERWRRERVRLRLRRDFISREGIVLAALSVVTKNGDLRSTRKLQFEAGPNR